VRAVRRVGRGLGHLGRALRRVPPDAWLALVALVMFIVGWSTITQTQQAPTSLLPVLAVMEVAPLLMLRRWPFYAWVVAIAASLLWWVFIPAVDGWQMPWPVVQFLVLLATVFTLALVGELVEVVGAVLITAAVFLVSLPDELKPWALGVALIAAFGLLIRWLVLSRRQLARRAEDVEVERARRAVLEERGRIARELHDVVAHHMSMVVVQAQSAPVRLTGVSPEVREELAAIETSARQALNEVRGLLGVLREEQGAARTAPQPGLDQVPGLLEGTRAAGVDLTWTLDITPDACPPGTALVLYRVLQESVANATRHAPGTPIRVSLREVDGSATLTVRNGPLTATDDERARLGTEVGGAATGGAGIPGMQARTEAVGGHLCAGPTPEGEFRVEAVVPLQGRPGSEALG
jgi:signal transduction histidine kinase